MLVWMTLYPNLPRRAAATSGNAMSSFPKDPHYIKEAETIT